MEIKPRGYCIDSDILIDYLRGVEDARNFLIGAAEKGNVSISVVSIVELYAGKETRDEDKRKHIDEFLQSFVLIGLDGTLARTAGKLRRDYEKPFADMIIAATALEYNLCLATRNIKHFDLLHKKSRLQLLKPY